MFVDSIDAAALTFRRLSSATRKEISTTVIDIYDEQVRISGRTPCAAPARRCVSRVS
jgi:hypothetical protein